MKLSGENQSPVQEPEPASFGLLTKLDALPLTPGLHMGIVKVCSCLLEVRWLQVLSAQLERTRPTNSRAHAAADIARLSTLGWRLAPTVSVTCPRRLTSSRALWLSLERPIGPSVLPVRPPLHPEGGPPTPAHWSWSRRPHLGRQGQAAATIAYWERLGTAEHVLLILAFLATVWFAAGVLGSQLRRVTQLYEGYPLQRVPLLGGLTDGLVEYHFHRRKLWRADLKRADDVFYAYPQGDKTDFMPSALGNTLRAAEYYGKYRYDIPITFFWPRLFYLAPEQFRRDIEEYRTSYEWLLGVSFMSMLATITVGLVELAASSAWWLFACTVGGGSMVSLAAYRGAVAAAEEYGAQLRAGVDLYRFEVLTALRWRSPDTLDEERAIWKEARLFHLRGMPRQSPYSPLPTASSETPQQRA